MVVSWFQGMGMGMGMNKEIGMGMEMEMNYVNVSFRDILISLYQIIHYQ